MGSAGAVWLLVHSSIVSASTALCIGAKARYHLVVTRQVNSQTASRAVCQKCQKASRVSQRPFKLRHRCTVHGLHEPAPHSSANCSLDVSEYRQNVKSVRSIHCRCNATAKMTTSWLKTTSTCAVSVPRAFTCVGSVTPDQNVLKRGPADCRRPDTTSVGTTTQCAQLSGEAPQHGARLRWLGSKQVSRRKLRHTRHSQPH
jgi:hypothetical protein